MAEPTANNMPLAGELALVQWLRGMSGNSNKLPNVPAPVMAQGFSGNDLQNLMTEYLRGQGNFLQNMRQQNVSGLYNTTTQKLLANDLMAQAALKATQANVPIRESNARTLNAYNAANFQRQLAQRQGPSSKDNMAALAIAGLNKLLGGNKKKPGAKEGSAKEGEGEGFDILGALGSIFGSDSGPAERVTSMDDFRGIAAEPQMSFDPGMIDFGNFGMPDMSMASPEFLSGQLDATNQSLGLDFGGGNDFDLGWQQPDYFEFQPDTFQGFQDSYGSDALLQYENPDEEYFFD